MIKIITYTEIYFINIDNIIYINIYEDEELKLTLDIEMINNNNIILDERDLERKDIIEIKNKLKDITLK